MRWWVVALVACGPTQSQPPDGGSDAAAESSGINGCLAVDVAAGVRHACARMHDNTVVCWGGATGMPTPPARVPNLTNVAQVATGSSVDCARLADGSVWCWGGNTYGELGDGTNTKSTTPVRVQGISNAKWVGVGFYHACAVLADGSVTCWGKNDVGQLGDGTTTNRNVPVPVAGVSGASQVSASEDDTCALVSSAPHVFCWGANAHGELGDGTTNESNTPIAVVGLTSAWSISLGSSGQYDYACVIDGLGGAWCWGSNFFGQLGDGTKTERHAPTQMTSISQVGSVSAGGPRTCMMTAISQTAQGMVACVGTAPLGDGTNTSSTTAVTVPSFFAEQVVANDDFACAVLVNGAVACWGNNGGSPTTNLTPTAVPIQLCQ